MRGAAKQNQSLPLTLRRLLLRLLLLVTTIDAASSDIRRGFSATPATPPPSSSFQRLLSDPSGTFSLGFLLVGTDQIDLAVVHLPSSLPLWRASPAQPFAWGPSTSLSFSGALVLSDSYTGHQWSTNTATSGDRVVLLPTSNLQVLSQLGAPLWQSFDFPADTLVQDQNFTSGAAVISTNQRFAMRLGPNYIGISMSLGERQQQQKQQPPMYWKQTALGLRSPVVEGKGPIYARVNASGFIGMYQVEGLLVHLIPFSSYNRGVIVPGGRGFWRLTLESSDGNLRGYYWNGTRWITDFVAITSTCDLPAACGAYGLCRPEGSGGSCVCLDNSTVVSSGADCFPEDTGDLCGEVNDFWVLRRTGVDMAYKEEVGFVKVRSLEECEGSCERNCSCWGVLYSNTSGSCHVLRFPIETMQAVGGAAKAGYFKVRRRRWKGGALRGTAAALLAVAVVVLAGVVLYGGYRIWRWRRMAHGSAVEGMPPVPYRDLKESSSFRSTELSSFRK